MAPPLGAAIGIGLRAARIGADRLRAERGRLAQPGSRAQSRQPRRKLCREPLRRDTTIGHAVARRPLVPRLRGSPRCSDLSAVHLRNLCVFKSLDSGPRPPRTAADRESEPGTRGTAGRTVSTRSRALAEARRPSCRARRRRLVMAPERDEDSSARQDAGPKIRPRPPSGRKLHVVGALFSPVRQPALMDPDRTSVMATQR